MNYLGTIICFLMAAFGVYGGVTGKVFYPGRLGRKATGKPIPTWLGRLWFFGFAAVAFYVGLKGLR